MSNQTAVNKSFLSRLKEEFITFPLYIYSRPFKGFGDLKYYGRGKTYFAVVSLVLYIISHIIRMLFMGFVIAGYGGGGGFNFNFLEMFLLNISPIALFTVANWSVTAITDGTGKARDIFMVYCYALYPQVFLILARVLVSHFITVEEAVFANMFNYIGTAMYGVYLFIGLIVIHEYSFFKSILMIILTILAMGIIIFVLALLVSLINEVWMFFSTVYTEITLRL